MDLVKAMHTYFGRQKRCHPPMSSFPLTEIALDRFQIRIDGRWHSFQNYFVQMVAVREPPFPRYLVKTYR